MKNKKKNFYQALAVMVGYIIGVGMFGLPFIAARTGVLVFLLYLLFFGLVQYLLHLIYANIIITTKQYHRLVGYSEKYLGKTGKYFAFAAKMIGNLGALLAYIIITGTFLYELLNSSIGGTPFLYSTLLFVFGAIVVFLGIKMIAKFELVMSFLLIMIVFLIVFKGREGIKIENYFLLNWKYVFLPYGMMLFSLDGNGSLPIVAKLLNKDKKLMKRVVRLGTLITTLIIAIFTLTIVGLSGSSTTPDALGGVKGIMENGIMVFALLFGILTIITSFLLVSEAAKETLWWDIKLNKNISWAIAVGVPYLVFLLGVRSLTAVVSFVGGVAGSLAGILLMLIFKKLRKKGKLPLFSRSPSMVIIYLLVLLFLCGLMYQFIYFFK